MENKKINKKRISSIIIIIIILIIVIIVKINKSNNLEEANSETEQIEVLATSPDEDVPESINILEMTQEQKIYSVAILDEFEDSSNLTNEQYLQVVYNALNNEYISLNENNTYTQSEISSIIYTIFGIELQLEESIEGLTYNDGIYTFEKSQNTSSLVLENIEDDVAAGTVYISFDIYTQDSSENKTLKGNYTVTVLQNTETGERYIKSMAMIHNM